MKVQDFTAGDRVKILMEGSYGGVHYHPGEIWYVKEAISEHLRIVKNLGDEKYTLVGVEDSQGTAKECEPFRGNENQPEPSYEIY